MLVRWPQLSHPLDRRYTPAHSMHANLLHFSLRTPQNLPFPDIFIGAIRKKELDCELALNIFVWIRHEKY